MIRRPPSLHLQEIASWKIIKLPRFAILWNWNYLQYHFEKNKTQKPKKINTSLVSKHEKIRSSPGNIVFPVSNSAMIHPTLHMSTVKNSEEPNLQTRILNPVEYERWNFFTNIVNVIQAKKLHRTYSTGC